MCASIFLPLCASVCQVPSCPLATNTSSTLQDALLVVGTELLDLYLASDGTESEIGDESDGNPSGDGSVGDRSFGAASSTASTAATPAAVAGTRTFNGGASGA